MAKCRLCCDLEKKDPDAPRLASDFTPRELLESSRSGQCAICPFILEGIVRFEDGSWTFAKSVSRVYIYALKNDTDTLTAEIYFQDDKPKLGLEFFVSGHSWKALRIRPRTTGYPVLSNGVKWVNLMQKKCARYHTTCPPSKETTLPKRLITFRRSASGDIKVRLWDSQSGQNEKYIALSYCWGSSHTCVTTVKTLRSHKEDIPWGSLPTTFQDAIEFCLGLEIQLLWVDALCIVQDDHKDWEIESAKMADIYQNAYLTLAATVSPNGSGGCFSKHLKPAREYRLETKVLPRATALYVRETLQHWTVSYTASSDKTFPLLSRGWVFQERYLSSRVLHFSSQELIWSCREATICECGDISSLQEPQKQLSLMNVKYERNKKAEMNAKRASFNIKQVWKRWSAEQSSTMIASPADTSSLDMIGEVSAEWHSIIQRFSALKLTKETDRLPALSGLAVRASNVLGAYLCGLWKHTLISDLMWRVPTIDRSSARPSTYIGPSWTWVSTNGPVKYWNDLNDNNELDETIRRLQEYSYTLETAGERLEAEVNAERKMRINSSLQGKAVLLRFDCNVTLAGKNPYGQVSSGVLHIQGHTVIGSLHYDWTGIDARSASAHQPHPKCQVKIHRHGNSANLDLAFYPDYPLNQGSQGLQEGAPIDLLLINRDICLVLRQREDGLVHSRIGIVRQPAALLILYNLDWMENSELKDFTIM